METARIINFQRFKPTPLMSLKLTDHITIIGVGSIGSILAEEIVKLGLVEKLTIVDYDVVERQNIERSAYDITHIGKYKVDALEEKLKTLYVNVPNIIKYKEKYTKDIKFISDDAICIDCRDGTTDQGLDELVHKIYIRGVDTLHVDTRPSKIRYTIKTHSKYSVGVNGKIVQRLIREYLSKLITKDIKLKIDNYIYNFRISKSGVVEFTENKIDRIVKRKLNLDNSKYHDYMDKSTIFNYMNRFIYNCDPESKIVIRNDSWNILHSFIPFDVSDSEILIKEIDAAIYLYEDLFNREQITASLYQNNLTLHPQMVCA